MVDRDGMMKSSSKDPSLVDIKKGSAPDREGSGQENIDKSIQHDPSDDKRRTLQEFHSSQSGAGG